MFVSLSSSSSVDLFRRQRNQWIRFRVKASNCITSDALSGEWQRRVDFDSYVRLKTLPKSVSLESSMLSSVSCYRHDENRKTAIGKCTTRIKTSDSFTLTDVTRCSLAWISVEIKCTKNKEIIRLIISWKNIKISTSVAN